MVTSHGAMRLDDDVALEDGVGWSVIIPVKALHAAKSRMNAAIPPAELAFAFFEDTLAAAVACPQVSEVLVATQDARIAARGRSQGCLVVRDSEHPGINAAVAWAADHARAADRLAVIVSDLPCLTPEALGSVLGAAAGHATAFLADADGTGTAMWFATDGATVRTHFGADSRASHQAAGAVDLVDAHPASAQAWTVARRDVDTAAALDDAALLGLGEHTTPHSIRGPSLARSGPSYSAPTTRSCSWTSTDASVRSPWQVAVDAGLVDLRRGQRVRGRGAAPTVPPASPCPSHRRGPPPEGEGPRRAGKQGRCYFLATAFLAGAFLTGAAFFTGAAFLTGAAFFTGAAFLTGAAFFTGAAFLTGAAFFTGQRPSSRERPSWQGPCSRSSWHRTPRP